MKDFLKRFVRFRLHNVHHPVASDADLDFWVPNARPFIYRDHVWHDGHYLEAVTMRDAPRVAQFDPKKKKDVYGTVAGIFSTIARIDCPLLVCLEWHPMSDKRARNHIVTLQKSFDGKIVSLMSQLFANKNDTRGDMRQDTSAVNNRDELGDALAELDSGTTMGEFSCTVLLHDEDRNRVRHAVPEVFRALRSATVMQEDQGTYDAWVPCIPGNYSKNVRAIRTSIKCVADMSLHLCGDDQGDPHNRLIPDKHCLAVYETNNGAIHYFSPHVGEMAGVLMYGEQGGGKTTRAGHMLDHFQRCQLRIDGRWRRPKTLVMDVKDSYRENTLRHGGSYLRLSLDNPGMGWNPFSLPRSKDTIDSIKLLIKLCLAGDDDFRTTPMHDQIIVREIEDKYLQKERQGLRAARFSNMNLGRDLQPRFEPWLAGNQYGGFFDVDYDTRERFCCEVWHHGFSSVEIRVDHRRESVQRSSVSGGSDPLGGALVSAVPARIRACLRTAYRARPSRRSQLYLALGPGLCARVE